MIAVIEADGRMAFVALRRDPRPGPVLIGRPIHTERGPNDESTPMAAARLCVAALQAQIETLVTQAKKALHQARRPDERIDTAEVNAHRLTLAATLSRELARAWADLRRLLDGPTESEHLALDGPIARRPDEPGAASPRPNEPRPLRAGRMLAWLDQVSAAGVSSTAISHIESGRTRNPKQATQIASRTTLEACGIEFAPGGWLRHIDDARAERRPPSDCIRCVQASYLLDMLGRLLGRVCVILREPDKPEPRTENESVGGTP